MTLCGRPNKAALQVVSVRPSYVSRLLASGHTITREQNG